MAGRALSPAIRELWRRRAKAELLPFVTWTFPGYRPHWHHQYLAEQLDRWRAGQSPNLIIAMPPRHGKTELVTRRLPALIFGREPTARIIVAAHTAALAEANSRDVQRIMESPEYQQLFPDVRLPQPGLPARRRAGRYKRTDEHWEIVGQGGYFRAVGVGGAITGFGLHYGIIDDPIKSADEAQSPVYRERVWEWFTRDFWTRREAGAKVLVCMTRWHSDDLVGRILRLQGQGLGEWHYIRLPAIAEDQRAEYDPREPGSALWPELINTDELAQIRAADPSGFAALYQADPSEAGGNEWPDEYFGRWLWVDANEWPSRDQYAYLVMAIDPSRGREDAASDYAAIVWVGIHRDSRLLYVDGDLAVRPPTATLDQAIELYDRMRPDCIVVETNQFQLLFAQELQRRARAGFGVSIPIIPVTNYLPKLLRIRRLGVWLAARDLRFRADSASARLIVDQLRQFPTGQHDDGPDALEMAVRILSYHAPRRIETLEYHPGESRVMLERPHGGWRGFGTDAW